MTKIVLGDIVYKNFVGIDSGVLNIGSTTAATYINLYDGVAASIILVVPVLSGSYSLTLPVDAGTLGYFLQTDGSGVTSWQPAIASASLSIATTVTDTVDSVAIATYRTVEWLVSFSDSVAGTYSASKIIANHDGTTVSWTEYAIVGTFTSYTPDVDISGGNMRLRILNSGANTIVVNTKRIEVVV